MSAFLGPIHQKMYSRILHQDALAESMLKLAESNGWADGLRQRVDSAYPAASSRPLEEIIDAGNIHGWLSAAVETCESRFAAVVGGILAGHPRRISQLQDAMRGLGRQSGLVSLPDAESAFTAVHDILLDGMPCDFPFDVMQMEAAEARWQVASCPHTPFWVTCDGGPEVYYLLRDAWVEGALEGSGISHTRHAGSHTIRKER